MDHHPKVTIGMPVYNGERFIASAIEAQLAQTFGDLELLIQDNASTDGTAAICADYARQDSRVRVVHNPQNVGAAENYNLLYRRARGEFFRWANADDLCAPELVQVCLAELCAHPEAVLAYGGTTLIDADGKELGPYTDNLDLREPSPVSRYRRFHRQVGLTNIIYGLMRRAPLATTALMGNGSYPAADTHFMAELCLYGTFIEIDRPLFLRRMHEECSSADRSDDVTQTGFWSGSASRGFRLGYLRSFGADLAGIRRAPLGPIERLQLYAFVLRRMLWSRTSIGREVIDWWLSRRTPSSGSTT